MDQTISRTELKAKMDRGDTFQLVEALPEENFHKHHLPGAINLPPKQVKELVSQLLPDKQADIVVYCANPSCTASHDVARELEAQGYRHVRRYVEGKQDWIDAGLPIEGQSQTAAATT